MIFGISGFARTGKDTFALSLEKILKLYEIKSERIAFASVLKKDLQPFLKEQFNIDSFTQDNDDKKIIRPLLVGYGESKRSQNPNYWIEQIELNRSKNSLIIITDVRYKNEAEWIIKNDGFLLNLDRQKKDGSFVEAPNEQEAINQPEVKNMSSFNLVWNTIEDEKNIDEIVESFLLSVLGEKIDSWKAIFPL